MDDDSQPADPPTSLAPWQHTLSIVVLFLLWCIIGGHRAQSVADGPHVFTYLSSVMVGWMALGTVVAGLYHRRQFFIDTLLRNARPWYVDAGRGVLIYFGAIALFIVVHLILRSTPLKHHFDRSTLMALAPRNGRELLTWTIVSFTAGFGEEHIFRGYLLPQGIAWSRSIGLSQSFAMMVSVIATSTLFGALHLYEGISGAIMIGTLGMFYAVLALRLGNLRAIIVAHFLQDFVTAALILFRHEYSR